MQSNRMIWRKIEPIGKLPGDRAAHSCDLINNKLYIFGGWNGINALADIYMYDFSNNIWTELISTGEMPSYRNNHTTAVYKQKLYVHGGHNGNSWLDDLYYLEIQNKNAVWHKAQALGPIPTARACHSLNRVGEKLYLFGGYDGQECFNEMEVYDLGQYYWHKPTVKGQIPTARNAHTMTRYSQNLYLFGGHSGAQHLQDLHMFNTQTSEWVQVQTQGVLPKGLRGHTANLIQNNIYIFGGYDGSGRSNDLFIFSILTSSWLIPNQHGSNQFCMENNEQLGLSQIPQPRQRHSATATEQDLIYIFGGFDGNKWLNDLYVLDIRLLENRTIQEENVYRVIQNINNNLFNNPEFSDITFEIDGQLLYGHKIYLAAQSEQFKGLFISGMGDSNDKTYKVQNASYKAFYNFLQFVYTGQIQLTEMSLELLSELLCLSDQYVIEGLKNLTQKILKQYITDLTVCQLLLLSSKYCSTNLKNACMQHLLKNITKIAQSAQYEQLEQQPSLLVDITRALLNQKE